MKPYIIFANSVKGHFLEYLHHLHEYCTQITKHDYIFVVPEEFLSVKNNLKWSESSNIQFDYISDDEIARTLKTNPIKRSIIFCKILNKRIVKYQSTNVFTLWLIPFLPAAVFLINKKIRISGIIYKIYFHEDSQSSLLTKIYNRYCFKILSHCKVFENIFILNDSESTSRISQIYNTTKFKNLSDPYIPFKEEDCVNLRNELGLSQTDQVFLHIGAIDKSKGTLEILDSIDLLQDSDLSKMVFLIIGRISPELEMSFLKKIDKLKKKGARIIIENCFCSYQRFISFCYTSNAILIPYRRTSQSSGVIGYAAQLHRPVIAPSGGLLGSIVRNNCLGITSDITPENLVKSYTEITTFTVDIEKANNYLNSNSLHSFISTIGKLL